MKVLHVTPYFKIGSMNILYELIQNLTKYDIEITVLTSGKKTVIEKGNFTVIRCKRYFNIATIPIWPSITKYLLSTHYDIVHNHFTVPWSADLTCFFNKYLKKKPMVTTIHSVLFKFSYLGRILTQLYNKTWFKHLLNNSRTIVLPSKSFFYENDLFFPYKNKIRIIPWGMDQNLFKKTLNHRLLEKYHIPKNHRILLYAGILLSTKGLIELINAMKIIYKEDQNCTLMIVGDGSFKKVLKKEIHNLGLEKNVIFTGWIPHTEMPAFYSIADIYIQPSFSESFCLSILEALSCETPVVASKNIGIKEIIRDEFGTFIETITAENIAKAVLNFQNRNQMNEMRDHIAKKFNWGKITKKIFNLYSELLN